MLYVTARPRLTEHLAGTAAGFPFTFIRYRHCSVVLITQRVWGNTNGGSYLWAWATEACQHRSSSLGRL